MQKGAGVSDPHAIICVYMGAGPILDCWQVRDLFSSEVWQQLLLNHAIVLTSLTLITFSFGAVNISAKFTARLSYAYIAAMMYVLMPGLLALCTLQYRVVSGSLFPRPICGVTISIRTYVYAYHNIAWNSILIVIIVNADLVVMMRTLKD